MAFADIPLSDELHRVVSAAFGVPDEKAVRLHGGEESAAYRIADLVVRIGSRHMRPPPCLR